MNILEAMQRGINGEKIKRDGGKWLTVCSDGITLRFINNRQVFHPNIPDIMATNWIAENDFVSLSNRQIIGVLSELGVNLEEQKAALKKLGFA